MDLNSTPTNISDFPVSLDIKIVTRKKVDCRDVLVRKYGEERYNAMISNPEPMVLPSFLYNMIIVFFCITNIFYLYLFGYLWVEEREYRPIRGFSVRKPLIVEWDNGQGDSGFS